MARKVLDFDLQHPKRKEAFLACAEVNARAVMLGESCEDLTGLTEEAWAKALEKLCMQIVSGECDLPGE